MCSGDLPQLLQNLHILKNNVKKDILYTKGHNSGNYKMIKFILKLELDIFMLIIVSKFLKVPFEIT